ncbi:MAG TPA: DUF4214 domain-containing protein [Ramlibacter sp.]|jgi:hypothetical protein
MATIQGIYIALFGRPADPAGLAFFNQATNNGQNLNAIGDLSASDEYQDRFEGLNNVQIVTKIYQDLFGRDPDAAGLAFFVAQLNSGAQNINTIAINILDGAQGADREIVDNKIAAANLFTAEINTAIEVGSYTGDIAEEQGRAYISAVTADDTTVPTQAEAAAAVQAVVDAGAAGNTFDLASGQDVSTSATTVLNGELTTNSNDTVTVTGAYVAATEINAGLGTDRVNISLAASQNLTATSLVGVERLYVDPTANVSLTVSAVDGLQQLWASGTGAFNLTFNDIEDTSIVGGVEGTNGNVLFDYDTTGDTDAATIVLNGDATGVNVDEIEALTLNVQGASDIGNLTVNSASTVDITGTGDLSFTLSGIGAAPDDRAVIDASAHVGKFNIDVDGYYDVDIVGGAQNDTFTITADNEGNTITGGSGSDLFDVGALSNIDDIAAASVEEDLISITDFNGSADVLRLDLTGALDVFNNVESANVTGAASLQAALVAAGAATSASNYSIFEYDGATYIYQNDAVAGFSANDGVIELVGFTGDLTASNFNTF